MLSHLDNLDDSWVDLGENTMDEPVERIISAEQAEDRMATHLK